MLHAIYRESDKKFSVPYLKLVYLTVQWYFRSLVVWRLSIIQPEWCLVSRKSIGCRQCTFWYGCCMERLERIWIFIKSNNYETY